MIYLLEIEPYDPSAGGTVTLRYASSGFVTAPGDTPANTVFPARIADPGNYERHLFGQGRTRGASDVAAGEIRLVNNDGALDGLLDMAFDGRALRLYGLASDAAPWSSRETVLIGTMEQAEFTGTHVVIRIRDRLALLDDKIQTETYLGTTVSGSATAAEGNKDLKDAPKPLLFGRCFSIPAITVDQFNNVYQVSSRAVASVEAVRDRGVALAATSDYPTLAALKAATLSGGQFATCLVLGMVRTYSRPAGTLTVDASEGSTLADRSAAKIVGRMLAGVSGVAVDAGDIAALHVANPAECGVWIGTSETQILAAASQVLDSVGASLGVDRFGVFRMARLVLPSGPGEQEIDNSVILDRGSNLSRLATGDEGNGVPARSVTVRWGRAYTTFSEEDLAGVAAADAFRSFGSQEWRQAKAVSAANATIHPKGPELVFETCLTTEADAVAEANRLLAIYGARRDLFSLAMPTKEAAGLDLGDVVTLRSPRFGLSAGRPLRVLGLTARYATAVTEVDLWG